MELRLATPGEYKPRRASEVTYLFGFPIGVSTYDANLYTSFIPMMHVMPLDGYQERNLELRPRRGLKVCMEFHACALPQLLQGDDTSTLWDGAVPAVAGRYVGLGEGLGMDARREVVVGKVAVVAVAVVVATANPERICDSGAVGRVRGICSA